MAVSSSVPHNLAFTCLLELGTAHWGRRLCLLQPEPTDRSLGRLDWANYESFSFQMFSSGREVEQVTARPAMAPAHPCDTQPSPGRD